MVRPSILASLGFPSSGCPHCGAKVNIYFDQYGIHEQKCVACLRQFVCRGSRSEYQLYRSRRDLFVDMLAKSQLLSEEVIHKAIGLVGEDESEVLLVGYFVSTGMVTYWQCKKLINGQFKGFHIGKLRMMDCIEGCWYRVESPQGPAVVRVLPEADPRTVKAAEIARLHPAIVRGAAVRKSWCVMTLYEFMAGESLEESIQKEGPLPAETAASVIAQLASAVQTAHQHGLANLAISPRKVFRTSNGVKLNLQPFTAAMPVSESIEFFAPEMRGDPRTDVFRLGRLWRYLVIGGEPAGTSRAKPARLDGEEANALVDRMLARNPEDRPSLDDVVAELLPFLPAPLAPSPTPPVKPPRDAVQFINAWLIRWLVVFGAIRFVLDLYAWLTGAAG